MEHLLAWAIRGPALPPLNLDANLSPLEKAEKRWEHNQPLVDRISHRIGILALITIGGELATIYFRGFKKYNGFASYLAIETLNMIPSAKIFFKQREAIPLYLNKNEHIEKAANYQPYDTALKKLFELGKNSLAYQAYNTVCAPIVNNLRQIFNF